jgi:hypothetical protein
MDAKGRQASFKDFTEYGPNEDQNGTPKNINQFWKSIHKKKINNTDDKNCRLSMNFIKIDDDNYSMRKL